MPRAQQPSQFPATQVPRRLDDEDRPYLLLDDLVNEPIAFTLSDFGSLPEDLPLPPVH